MRDVMYSIITRCKGMSGGRPDHRRCMVISDFPRPADASARSDGTCVSPIHKPAARQLVDQFKAFVLKYSVKRLDVKRAVATMLSLLIHEQNDSHDVQNTPKTSKASRKNTKEKAKRITAK